MEPMPNGFFSGQLLIAMPGISDPRFERAVILVCAHDADHAMGMAVNRPLEGVTVLDLLDRLEIRFDARAPRDLVLLGGPVERERGFVLHTDDYDAPGGLPVGDGVILTGAREVLVAMAHGDHRPRRSLLALGYAGWGAGQLEDELKQNVWLACDADEGLIFDVDHKAKWGHALGKLGIDPHWLGSEAGRA
nr:YqgE/AlgH family protein [Phenylobacterium immobile]